MVNDLNIRMVISWTSIKEERGSLAGEGKIIGTITVALSIYLQDRRFQTLRQSKVAEKIVRKQLLWLPALAEHILPIDA